uniref:Transposase Tc1-like domain-containing protein n=1 Tax=Anguilla anguilla TaxID=7936 RepID=A0A0E9WBT9_ANGAN
MSMQDVIRLSARTVCPQLHREEHDSTVALHKPLITKTNAHLRVQWCKNNRHWSIYRDVDKSWTKAQPSDKISS